MKNTYVITSRFFASVALITAAIWLLSSCSKGKTIDTNSPAYFINQAESLTIPDAVALPANLPGGNTRVATFFANGVQKYKAQQVAGSSPVTYQWVFVAPQADLYDINNNKVGAHSAGPDWELSPADSMFGQSFTPARTAPSSDPNGIDWLLLMPKTGKTSTGIFANVSYVQRIATKGGKAPATPPVNETDAVDVPYTAIYRFSKIN